MEQLTYKEAIAIYKEAHLEYLRGKFTMPDIELQGIAKNSPHNFKLSNGITKGIIKYCTFRGAFCNRINVSGRVIKTKSHTTGAGGIIEGKAVRIPSATKRGTPDIDIVYNSLPIKIEVKAEATRDTIKPAQLKVKEQLEAAGAIYFIATTFEGFLSWWIDTIEKQNPALSA